MGLRLARRGRTGSGHCNTGSHLVRGLGVPGTCCANMACRVFQHSGRQPDTLHRFRDQGDLAGDS